jgi:hypothetical protein
MGKFSPTANNIWQQLGTSALNGAVRGSPAYFNGTLYYGPRDVTLKAFTFANAKLPATATATNLAHELYDSRQATGNRDVTGPGASGSGLKFVVPVVANGKVFMGTPSSVAVFGMLH